jgi:hypothetical protein
MGMDKKCECGCCCDEEESFGDSMVELADKAWMKVVQRRLEAILEKEQGKELDRVAKVTYEYAKKFYTAQMSGKELPKGSAEEFEKKLMAAMKG